MKIPARVFWIFAALWLPPQVWQPCQAEDDKFLGNFLANHCLDCHHQADPSGGVRLDNIDTLDWSEHETSWFLQRVMKVLRQRRMPPEDAGQVEHEERARAVSSLHKLLMEHSVAGGTPLRRLTRREYEQTIRKVFGIEFEAPSGFPAERPTGEFDNMAEGLVVSGPLMDAYFQSAIEIADTIVPRPPPPAKPTLTRIPADELVISYSSGAIVDGAMRLAARTDSMWRSATWPERFEVRSAGTYRIAVSASRLEPATAAWPEFAQPMKLQVRARSLNARDGDPVTKQRLLAEFEVTRDSPEVFECVAEMQPAETPVLYFANAPIDGVKGDEGAFAEALRKMFDNDPRLLAAWQQVEHSRGLRGGIGWDRVKRIRDSDDLDLKSSDRSDKAIDKLVKKMSKNPGLYAETVVYQFFEEGPALQIHQVDIEGPLRLIKTEEEKRQQAVAKRFLGRRDDSTDTEQYVRSFLERFLTHAFRRPAKEADVRRYTEMVLAHAAETDSLNNGLHLAIRTVLMSPKFLYRGHYDGALDDYDLAVRLSYFLTGGPPDQKLFEAARRGELSDAAGLERQTRRLLDSPDLQHFLSDFTAQWLQTRRLQDIMPDARLFPQFEPRHRRSMITESERFFAEVLNENLPLETLIQPDFTFLDQALAEDIYERDDLELEGKGFQRVSISPESPYGGLLGQAAVMMATGNGFDSQPVTRGVWVLENILGDPPPPPPETVPALTPDTQGASDIRQLLAAHQSDDSCAVCHRRIDPIGLVLENFDPIGRWRTHYPVLLDKQGEPAVADGAEIDAAVEFPGDSPWSDVDDLKRHVVDNIDSLGLCLAEKFFSYATGRRGSYAERQELQQRVTEVRAQGNGLKDLLIAVVTSESFGVK